MKRAKSKDRNSNILQIVNQIEEIIKNKQLIESPSKMLLTISGGQDSIFLLFCFSFLQSQLDFSFKVVWCNHFWQTDSFYTTLHLTKSTLAFSAPTIGFVPLHTDSLVSRAHKVLLEQNRARVKKKVKPSLIRLVLGKAIALRSVPVRPPTCSLCEQSNSGVRQVGVRTLLFFALQNNPKKNKEGRTKKSQLFCGPEPLVAEPPALSNPEVALPPRAYLQGFGKQSKGTVNPFEVSKVRRKGGWKEEGARRKPVWLLLRDSNDGAQSRRGLKKTKRFLEQFSETRARNWRHMAIERGCTFYNSNRCVYGHTLSDRVETILFNLIRGSGNRGTTSLPLKREHSRFCYNKFYPCLEQLKKNTHISNC